MSYTESVSIPGGFFVLPNVITNLGISHAEKESPQFVYFPSLSFKAAEKHNCLLVHTCSYWVSIKSAGITFRSKGFSQEDRKAQASENLSFQYSQWNSGFRQLQEGTPSYLD